MFKNKMRGAWVGFVAAFTVLLSTGTAFAETTISTIGVRFVNNYDNDGGTLLEPTVSYSGDGFSEGGISWSKEVDKWTPGSKITATITLVPDEGKEFNGSYTGSGSNRKISVGGADFISAKRVGDDGSLTVKVSYYPVVQLGDTESAGWSDAAKTKAVWKKVPYATAYQLRLYSGDNTYETTLTLVGTSVDLSEYMTRQTNYYYEVKATSKDSSDAKYMKSGDYVASTDIFVEEIGEVGGRWQQTREGYRYTDEQGVLASNGWRYILGHWYYFDEAGYAATGWQNVSGKWYYMNSDCKMMTGWLELGDRWYYADATGAMVTGWCQLTPGETYYFYEDGAMAVSTVIDGRTLSDTGRVAQ